MLDARQIDTEFKERWRELRDKLGRAPNFQEESALSAWYKDAHHALSATTVKTGDGSEITVGEGMCRDCAGPIEPKLGRGRKPVRCNACRGV